jgi:hypothetical protein
MSEIKKLSSFIFGLIFIILGFLTFSYIEYVNQRPAVASSNVLYYVIAAGFFFIAIGTIFMIRFTKKDLKKKKKKKSAQTSLTCYFCGISGNNKTIKKFPKISPEYGGKYCCFSCFNKHIKK